MPHSCRLYKTLLQGGHYSQQTKGVVRAPAECFTPSAFASTWVKVVGKDDTRAIALGGGAFVVAALCERIKEDGNAEEKKLVRGWFGTAFKDELMNGDVKGKNILLGALDGGW